jgi:hypothetical protein
MTNQQIILDAWADSHSTFDIEAMKRGDTFRAMLPTPATEAYSGDTIVRPLYDYPEVEAVFFHMRRDHLSGQYIAVGTYKNEAWTVCEFPVP